MRNGLFRMLSPLAAGLLLLQLSSCASLFELVEEDDIHSYDRGYRAEAEEEDLCGGRSCHTEADARPSRAPANFASEGRREVSHVRRAIQTRDIILGMTRQDVMESWGQPAQREVAGSGSRGHERWIYGSRYNFSGSRTVIFEDGRVAGWHR